MTTKTRVLVTNDDGIDADGIHVLVASLVALGSVGCRDPIAQLAQVVV